MNTYKLYVASLRVSIREPEQDIYDDSSKYKHLKYVLVRSNDMAKFRDVATRQIYTSNFSYGSVVAIDLDNVESFNEATGNTQKHMSKRKALTLFNKRVNEMNTEE